MTVKGGGEDNSKVVMSAKSVVIHTGDSTIKPRFRAPEDSERVRVTVEPRA
jgi:hypothetical protein